MHVNISRVVTKFHNLQCILFYMSLWNNLTSSLFIIRCMLHACSATLEKIITGSWILKEIINILTSKQHLLLYQVFISFQISSWIFFLKRILLFFAKFFLNNKVVTQSVALSYKNVDKCENKSRYYRIISLL